MGGPWCQAYVNIGDLEDALLVCDRQHDDQGLHHDKDRDVWWYCPDWLPEIAREKLEALS